MWQQNYEPVGGSLGWSALVAAIPIVVLFVMLGVRRKPAWMAALAALGVAFVLALFAYGMPARLALMAALTGAAYGVFPISWIVFSSIMLYRLAVDTGKFEIIKDSVGGLTNDRRLQALFIAFSFGAFIEGAAGFGTPVAITAALLMGLGFTPLYAAGLSLIANTAPVAYGAIGTPILTLGAVTGISPDLLSAMAGRQLPFVSLLVPAWLVVTMSGWRGLRGAWPAVLVCGGTFAIVQFLWSNYVGPELVDIMGGLVSLGCLALFCTWWKPAEVWDFPLASGAAPAVVPVTGAIARADLVRAWMPWVFLSVFVTIWGIGPTKAFLNAGPAGTAIYRQKHVAPPPHAVLSPAFEVPGLHRMVYREHPVEVDAVDRTRMHDPAYKAKRAEAARFNFNWLSATGTAILLAALVTSIFLRIPPMVVLGTAGTTLTRMRWPLLTIAFMLSLGFVTRYGGTDATLGLAFTRTGWFYPFFAAMLGWLGVALTGSDTSSNVLFGSLQKITAQQLGLNPILITTANSTGGVMGKMIDAQSIVVATAATNQLGQEGRILRFVFWHSVALAVIMGIIVMLQAYVFQWMVPAG
jgi:lactate permease